MIETVASLAALLVFWTLLVAVAGFAALAAWCVAVELTEWALRRRLRHGAQDTFPYGQPVLQRGRSSRR